jgi:hypothetical protein
LPVSITAQRAIQSSLLDRKSSTLPIAPSVALMSNPWRSEARHNIEISLSLLHLSNDGRANRFLTIAGRGCHERN